MNTIYKFPIKTGATTLIICTILTVLVTGLLIIDQKVKGTKATFSVGGILSEDNLIVAQGNSLLPISDPTDPEPKVTRKIRMIATAYSSTVWETDSTPFITASGSWVKDGIIANNLLPFGTRVRIPEIYGDKIFIVEDRMHSRKGYYQLDIWFSDYSEAKNFGAKNVYIEVLES